MERPKRKVTLFDCDECEARTTAVILGTGERRVLLQANQPYRERLVLGQCLRCKCLLVGESIQIGFAGINTTEDVWTELERVYPDPPKEFQSDRIPELVTDSLDEARKVIRVGAYAAACVMLGRALEAVCRDQLKADSSSAQHNTGGRRVLMLADGLKHMRARGIIDGKLYEWSEQLRAFRNLAAHAGEEEEVEDEDVEDLQTFVHAIVEYVYDLSERYEEFKKRQAARAQKRSKTQ